MNKINQYFKSSTILRGVILYLSLTIPAIVAMMTGFGGELRDLFGDKWGAAAIILFNTINVMFIVAQRIKTTKPVGDL